MIIRLPPGPSAGPTSVPLFRSGTAPPAGVSVVQCPDDITPQSTIYLSDGSDGGGSYGQDALLGCPSPSNGGGNMAGSGAANVGMVSPTPPGSSQPTYPAFATEPDDVTATAGATAAFSAIADGEAPLSYQWRRDGVVLSGATDSSYALVAQATDNGARFSVAVRNARGTLVSREAILTVAGCQDQALDGDESDVDCGGHCPGCDTGGRCRGAADCASSVCAPDGTCAQSTCSDGVRNQGESGVDCGGSSPCAACALGFGCLADSDCQSGHCSVAQTGKLCAGIDYCVGDCDVVTPDGLSCVPAVDGTDPRHICGTFDRQACFSGNCGCIPPGTLCRSLDPTNQYYIVSCPDLTVDRDNCGACGAGCGWACASPACVAPVEMSVGAEADCVRDESGRVACWGSNDFGCVLDGTTDVRKTPAYIPALSNVVQLAGRCALRPSGQVICWGPNDHGQVGNGTINASGDYVLAPAVVSGLTDAVGISTADYTPYACAVRANGQVVCWGDNLFGHLGDGTTMDRSTPVTVSGITDAVEVSVGEYHACARRSSGAVACWGWDAFGGLGDQPTTTAERHTPVAVIGLTDAVQIQAEGLRSCARRASGQVLCWGYNSVDAQLGQGPPRCRTWCRSRFPG